MGFNFQMYAALHEQITVIDKGYFLLSFEQLHILCICSNNFQKLTENIIKEFYDAYRAA